MIGLAATRGDASITEARVFDLDEHRRRRETRTEPWVPKEKIAEHFGVSVRTVYRWVTIGAPKKRLPGGTLRFQLGPMIEWITERGPG